MGVLMSAASLRNGDLKAINQMSPEDGHAAPGHGSPRELQPVFEGGDEG